MYVVVCGGFQLTECSEEERRKGLVIPCLIYNIDKVSNARCRELLERLEPLVFTNYQLIYKFVDDCGDDVKRLQCGRTDSDDDGRKVHTLHTLYVHIFFRACGHWPFSRLSGSRC